MGTLIKMKFISWNIDSLNAGLTATSPRGQMTFGVLENLASMKPDVLALQETKLKETGPTKKHLEILGNLFPEYKIVWRSSCEPARKGYAGTMFLYKEEYTPEVEKAVISAPSTMDCEDVSLLSNLKIFILLKYIHRMLVTHLNDYQNVNCGMINTETT